MVTGANDRMVVADGHRLRSRWFARKPRPDAPVILFLHQGLGSVTQWRRFPEQLAAASGCAAVGYDRWGHGASEPLILPRSPDFLEREAERALPDVLDTLGLDRVVLYGHSDGGTIALLAAAAHPHRISAVISEAAHVFAEAGRRPGSRGSSPTSRRADCATPLAATTATTSTICSTAGPMPRSPAMQSWSMIDKLPAVRCPTLVIQGADDSHGSPAQVETIAHGVTGPVETLVMPGVGHAPHLEATETVVARVAEFLGWAIGIEMAEG